MKGEKIEMDVKIVGEIRFQTKIIPVYRDLDAPLFKAADIVDLVEYSEGNVWKLTRLCEADEYLKLPVVVSGQNRQTTFVTETGLYNILSQSRRPMARAWRRVVHEELIAMRRAQGKNVSDCGFEQSLSNKLKYCPNCGIKMDISE